MNELPKTIKSQIGLNEVLAIQENTIREALNCHNIGKVIAFYPETQTADIQIMALKKIHEETLFPAVLSGVPLIIYGAGGGHITLPCPTGTICLLLFMDRNIDAFLETEEQYVPETNRMHDFTDCIALTTFKTLVNPLTEYDERAVSILNEEVIKEVKANSFIKVYGNSIELKTNIEGEEPSGASVKISDKVEIANTKQSLAALIKAFVSACENIATVKGGTLTPISKQAFTDLKSQFEELLI